MASVDVVALGLHVFVEAETAGRGDDWAVHQHLIEDVVDLGERIIVRAGDTEGRD